jgi:hypothetical protein
MIRIKSEALKEYGKYFLDLSKILIALTLITPMVKGGGIAWQAVFVTIVVFGVGAYLTNKGAKDE